ncbi:hypothetical protein ACJ41O_007731 [Fusarium nematophilum]
MSYPPDYPLTQEKIQDIVIEDIIRQDIIDERFRLAALALLLTRRDDDESSNSVWISDSHYSLKRDLENSFKPQDTSYYYTEEEEEDSEFWDNTLSPIKDNELEPTTKKRAAPHDETPCPAPRGEAQTQARKRQRLDPAAATSEQQPPTTAAKDEAKGQQQQAAAKRQRVPAPPPPAAAAASSDKRVFKEDNSHLHPTLQMMLHGVSLSVAHPAAQKFLLRMDCDAINAIDLAKAVFDMGIRFSKTATAGEFDMVFRHLGESYVNPIRYFASNSTAKHRFFWKKIEAATGKPMPPDQLANSTRNDARLPPDAQVVPPVAPPGQPKQPGPGPAQRRVGLSSARHRPSGTLLKAEFIKEVDETTKLPLNERVRKWLDDIVPSQGRVD